MLLPVLCGCYILILIGSYYYNDRELLAPSVLFTAGFTVCALMALAFSGRWGFELHIETFLVLLFGVLVFVAVASGIHYVLKKKWRCSQSDYSAITLPNNKLALLIFIVLQIIVFVWTLVEIANMFPADSIQESIQLYDQAGKFSDTGVQGFRQPLSIMRNICIAWGYFVAYLLAQNIVAKRYCELPLVVLSLLLACAVNMETGGRTTTVALLAYVVICSLALRKAKAGGKALPNAKIAAVLVVVSVVLVLGFQPSLELLGRSSSRDPLEYLSIYIGSEIPNLDTFIQTEGRQYPSIWGYMTFITSIRWLGVKFGIDDWVYQLDLPFQTMNGYSLGNVYTTFYAPIFDFGYFGLFVLVAVMAIVSQLVFEKAIRFNSGGWSSVWLIVYSVLGFVLLMSFFSNKFYENFLCINMARQVVYLVLVYLVYTHVKAKKPKDDGLADDLPIAHDSATEKQSASMGDKYVDEALPSADS